jgi:hypothetical protein
LATAVVGLSLLALLTACGSPDPDREPGPNDLEGFEFDPIATIEVSDDGIEPGELEAKLGDVVLVENVGDRPVQVRGDDGVDTGEMQPGDGPVTVVLSEDGESVWQVVGHEGERGYTLTIEVAPAPEE